VVFAKDGGDNVKWIDVADDGTLSESAPDF